MNIEKLKHKYTEIPLIKANTEFDGMKASPGLQWFVGVLNGFEIILYPWVKGASKHVEILAGTIKDIWDLLIEIDRLQNELFIRERASKRNGLAAMIGLERSQELQNKIEQLQAESDIQKEALRKFKAIEYNGERYDHDTRSERAACIFCGRFHNEHSHRDDCPYSVVNSIPGQ